MPTDTSEQGLERLICTALAGHPCDPPVVDSVQDTRAAYGGVGWTGGSWREYDREYCVDLAQLTAFLDETQPDQTESLNLAEDGAARRKFLARLQGEITKRGTIDVLRHGLSHGAHDFKLFYASPSEGNESARERFEQNRFTVTRQLRYSRDDAQRALDIALFINGLPVFTFELKNNLTKQTVDDAVRQYRKDRNPRERLFEFGRCIAHFAVDEADVRFCTHLTGASAWFLPFNRGWNDGAGNPPNLSGIKTDYLWREVLKREGVADIIENYAQVVHAKDARTARATKTQIWPRYHQLDAVRRLLADASDNGVGRRYLVQHSAGSGKSNSIAWLAHQLIGLEIDPVPTAAGGGRREPEIDRLSNILRDFNDHFGDIAWEDADRVRQLITETIPSRVADDTAFRNARANSDEQNARIEHDRALLRVMTSVMKDDAELFKQFMDNDGFKRWMTDAVFGLAYDQAASG